MRGPGGGGAILRLGILPCSFVLYFLTMMLNHAPCGGPHNGMMSGDMSDNTANGRPLQASLAIPRRG